MIILKRSSGYTKLDLVVRAHNTMNNTIDYAVLLPTGEISWMNGTIKENGTKREAKILFDTLNEIAYRELKELPPDPISLGLKIMKGKL